VESQQALQDRFGLPVAFSLRASLDDQADPLARLLEAIGKAGGRLGQIQLAEQHHGKTVYDLQLFVKDDEHLRQVAAAAEGVTGVEAVALTDLAMESHRGGACEMRSRTPIRSNTDLRIVYTPGVARVCKAIQADPAKARQFTNVANKVAIATNGTAILGLGDIGPLAGLPVMEGKAAIFWEFAGISAEPILIDTRDPGEFVSVMEKLACGFGAIQIEDVAAPACFQITRELDRRLNIPVFHDDQHGTATIVLAGLYAALKTTGRKIHQIRVAISGAGAAGTAIAEILQLAGVDDVVLCDRGGVLYPGRRENMNPEKAALAERTNKDNVKGTLADAMRGRGLFVGVSQAGLVSKEMVRSMAADPIVFALANPVSEISVADAYQAGAAVAADGRIMNNALAYPGIFRGALDAAAESITTDMLMAAAKALAALVPQRQLMPEMMDRATHHAVAAAVMQVAGQA